MPILTYIKLGAVMVVLAVIAFFVIRGHVLSAELTTAKAQLSSCQDANSTFAAEVAEQNKKIGDLLQETQSLENAAAAAAAKTQAETTVHVQTVDKVVIPKECTEAVKWANSQAPSLALWSSR